MRGSKRSWRLLAIRMFRCQLGQAWQIVITRTFLYLATTMLVVEKARKPITFQEVAAENEPPS
ncbi:hypothetical protein CLV36_108121 [Laceyella sediminis]|uniref:Uncharacterized protein n=1 Tax=Laceyella sediminis TaxID=573074 RepID=A0ABX5EMS8_9BACL|nr:hypothetical protein CLV36_108121 [Laceyella sediminis]